MRIEEFGKSVFGKVCPLLFLVAMPALFVSHCGYSDAGLGIAGREGMAQKVYSPSGAGTKVPNEAAHYDTFFENYGVNPFIDTDEDNLSTFALDVDTASYSISRAYIQEGYLPPKDAVRVEEFVNYMKYGYPDPEKGKFGIYLEGAVSKFGNPEIHKLLRIGIEGKGMPRKDAVLTFVIDVSGSMNLDNRLGLVKRSLRVLLDQLRKGDSVGIVVYGSTAEVILRHHGLEHKRRIEDAIESLVSTGVTNADQGIRLGYRLADSAFKQGAVNRVILCSDGVANQGDTSAERILPKVKEYADKGITLTTVGFGMDNYNDILMEKLADRGNGNYFFVDNLNEARRVFVDNLTSNLQVIAGDAKVQVEFNPKVVRSYRLLGYENRAIEDEEFRDENVDAGEIGAGHQVTALYEIKLEKGAATGNVATVRLRYKDPDLENLAVEIESDIALEAFKDSFEAASPDFRLAAVVAEFSEILRKSYWAKGGSLEDVLEAAQDLPKENRSVAEVIEFIDLVSKAGRIETED